MRVDGGGATGGSVGGDDSVPGQEALFRRVPMSALQAQVDVGQQLVERRPGMYQVPRQRLSTQAGRTLFLILLLIIRVLIVSVAY